MTRESSGKRKVKESLGWGKEGGSVEFVVTTGDRVACTSPPSMVCSENVVFILRFLPFLSRKCSG